MFEPLQYDFMQNAYAAGTVIAILAAVVGFFVVLRGIAFAADALAHMGFAGAAGALVFNADPLLGMLVMNFAAALGMGALGERIRGRDVAIGVVLTFSLGLGALFLSIYTRYATQAMNILFGTILGVSHTDLIVSIVLGLVTLAILAFLFRPLLFASVDPEVAAARGVPVRTISIVFLLIVALAVAESVQVVGVLLMFTLLISPAASAAYFVSRPRQAIALSIVLALIEVWAGITMAYYTKYPVSFYIATIGFVLYLAARFSSPYLRRGRGTRVRLASPDLSLEPELRP